MEIKLGKMQDDIQKLNLDSVLRPQMREAMGEARPLEKSLKEGNKALFHPSVRYMTKPHSKGAGAVNFVIPVYTIGIILFFLYSLLKTVFKPQPETYLSYKNDSQKVLCPLSSSETEEVLIRRKDTVQERKTQHALEQYGKDKVLTALKTIILEMEDFKGNLNGKDVQENFVSDSNDVPSLKNLRPKSEL
ncbi:uncharacterized protein [Parasteatoda tepidariorum]|uniref:uncharacterized protein isoform X2 n=1 Tax=Parasteatoda tepidariorum TaxID=114398 RepID=UPI0039BCDAA6